jgi:hypothetical protein
MVGVCDERLEAIAIQRLGSIYAPAQVTRAAQTGDTITGGQVADAIARGLPWRWRDSGLSG